MLKKFTITSLALILLLGLGLFSYGWYLAGHIEQRFSARRWSVPSKVYSDTTLLYPGQRINPNLLKDKLGALGYHNVSRQPEKKGEVQTSADAIAIFLNDLKIPGNNRKGFAVRIAMSAGVIESIVRTADGTVVPILELEPEEISLFFGS